MMTVAIGGKPATLLDLETMTELARRSGAGDDSTVDLSGVSGVTIMVELPDVPVCSVRVLEPGEELLPHPDEPRR